MNMSRNIFVAALSVARSRRKPFTSSKDCDNAATNVLRVTLIRFYTGPGVTPGNVSCSLSRNSATKLSDKLKEKLPCVTRHGVGGGGRAAQLNFYWKRGRIENEENKVEKGVHIYQLDR